MSGNTVPMLWFENEKGERFVPGPEFDRPHEYRYMHYRNPLEVHDEFYVDGERAMSGTQTYPASLVLALTRPTWRERLRAILRYGWIGPRLALDAAIIRAACGCEHCMNVLAHRAGLPWGYRDGSAEDRSNTTCEFCNRPVHPVDPMSRVTLAHTEEP